MLTLYHAMHSICSEKARICLHETGLAFEGRLVGLATNDQPAAEYLKRNPDGVVTTLVHDGEPVTDSGVSGESPDEQFDSASSVPHGRAGKLSALAAVGPGRLLALPGVPTLREPGVPDREIAGGWYGILAPAGTPRSTVQRLNTEIVRILRTPEAIGRINAFAPGPTNPTPEELGAALHDDFTRLGPVAQQIGLKPEQA